jgi:hypothetical protein
VTTRDIKSIKSIIRSVRFSPTFSELVEAECHARKLSLSEYVRQSAMANMRYMRRQAMESWGRLVCHTCKGERLNWHNRTHPNQLRGFVDSGTLLDTLEQSEIPTKGREYDGVLIDCVHTTSIQSPAIRDMTEICGDRKAMTRGYHKPLTQ